MPLESEGLDDFGEFTLDGYDVFACEVFHELLGDGTTATTFGVAGDEIECGTSGGTPIDASVIPKAGIFDGYGGIEEILWHFF